MILLFLIWPLSKCAEEADLNNKEIFDQLATASENIVHVAKQMNESSKYPQEHRSSVSSSLDATMYYENSNGFMPMIPSASPSYDPESSSLGPNDLEEISEGDNATNAVSSRDNSDTMNAEKLEEDLAYSSEARIFLSFPGSLTNRRSFDFQTAGLNEFELLKVNNDTPAVANYKDFYENVRNTDNGGIDESSSSGHVGGGQRVKGIENRYSGKSYTQYYKYNGAQGMKKTAYEQEKVAGNYRSQDTANYDGHGQSATRQNAMAPAIHPSSSRTSYEVNELGRGIYDNVAQFSKNHHRLSRPVVVAEPNSYKADAFRFSQLRGSRPDIDYNTSLEPSSSEMSGHYEAYGDNKQRSYNHAEDSKNSDESAEYTEYIERPKLRQKIRRRPDSTRKIPKEHRVTADDSAEEDKVHTYSSAKPPRYRTKANPWLNDPTVSQLDESHENVKHDSRGSGTGTKNAKTHHASRPKHVSTWNQVSPNLEISHSSGIELDELEKPKFVVPVKVNLVPLASFDHATALDSSQGFDVSNAMLQNFVTAAPIGAFSTAAPILSTPQPVIGKTLHNVQSLGVSTSSVPDVIVGQSSFQNPVHTVLLSQPTGQSKNYLPSTVTPVFALTSSLSPTLQSMPIQNVQDNVTPRTAFVTPTPTPIVQQLPVNQLHSGMQQLIVPTIQTFLQAPLQTGQSYQIQVNPHGLQGQNLINHNLQVHSLPTAPTLLSGQPTSRINLISADSQGKKNAYSTSSANFLASTSLTVGQNDQKLMSNTNSYYVQPTNPQGAFQEIAMTPKTKTLVQATQVVPTIIQPGATLSGLAAVNAQQLIPTQQNPGLILQQPRDQPQQYIKLQTANGMDNIAQQQLQIQMNKQLMKNNRLPMAFDSSASHTNHVNVIGATSSGTAHLPNVGTKNVEILNPNLKPSEAATVNTFQAMQYPATVLTTPIPIFNTVTPITPHSVNLQSYMDSLTESGAKSKQVGGNMDLKPLQNQERPMFNPINFVPNVDIIKNQNDLNNKLPTSEPLQQGLNLVPVMPGGNFFKPSYVAQNELMMKPKLASDLQKYAEEMFKESLKTIYNSQKWNNDRRQQQATNQNNSEASDLAKLRIELQRLQASLSENKYKDLLEAYPSENKLRAPDSIKSGKKKPEALLATLEHVLKSRPSGPIHIIHSNGRPGHKHKSPGDSGFDADFYDNYDSASQLMGYLTPPRLNGFHNRPFHDKPKKRPGSSRPFKNGPRKPMRSNRSPPRSSGLDTSANSPIAIHLDESRYHGSSFDHDYDSKQQSSFESYPSFTTPSPEILKNMLRELKASSGKDHDINHPRMHNLLGLLMKNKQLPLRNAPSYYRDRDQVGHYFESEKHRLHQQFYDDALKDYLDRADVTSRQTFRPNGKVYSGNGAA